MPTISRNNFSVTIADKFYGTSYANTKIFNAVSNNDIGYEVVILQEQQRLDQIAGSIYGSSNYWWIIAAASGIGWGLQLGPGTLLKIPTNLEEVLSILWQKDIQILIESKEAMS